jgi:transcriptional regulator with PAS, ATPase and Fis domain
VGRFELAGKGTIFLDEIGDLELSSQVKLLRVLQDRTYEVLGSSRSRTVDVRVIAATNRNLEEMVGKGTFREDLLYRINLITLKLPALRERPNDIPLLVGHFIKNLSELYARPLRVERDALQWLKQLPLPGNIRQLKNLVERAVLISPEDVLSLDDFRQQYQPSGTKGAAGLPEVGAMTLEEMEVRMIERAMTFHKGKIARVARSLGLTRGALYRRLDKYRIPYSEEET